MASEPLRHGDGTSYGTSAEPNVAAAALHIQGALNGLAVVHPRVGGSYRLAHLLHSRAMYWPVVSVLARLRTP